MSEKNFPYDNPVMNSLSTIGDILLLNVMFLLGSLPIVTVGVSITAMYYTLFCMRGKDDKPLWEMFWHSYRDNFRQGIIIQILFLLVGVILYFDYQIIQLPQLSMSTVWYILTVFLIVLYQLGLLYVFPLLAYFNNSVLQTIRNAFLIAMSRPFQSFFLCALNLLPVLLFLYFPILFWGTGIFWMIIGFAGIAWICSGYFGKIFRQIQKDF